MDILLLSWVRIVEEFSLRLILYNTYIHSSYKFLILFRYDSIFLQTTAKAHLDYSSCIVDGAKGNCSYYY